MSQITNTTQPMFDFPSFLRLSESDLVAYMEPVLNDPTLVVEPEVLRQMAADLASYDEYHLVYAIELGVDQDASMFALTVARCLAHPAQSVRLAAHRTLSRLPAQAISDELINACNAAIAAGSSPAEVGDLPEILERRRRLPHRV